MNEPLFQPPAPLGEGLISNWLLDPSITFVNHGSFGATPRVALDEQTKWRERIEREPVEFIGRRGMDLVEEAKTDIGAWLGMEKKDFGLVTNATEGINAVLRSLKLQPGDELLTTTHVYNAVRQAMKYIASRAGATCREVEFALPVNSGDEIAEAILGTISDRTRLVLIDHVSSPTALVFPVEKIIAGCAERGIDVLVDGAHGPGMLPLDIGKLGAAYYAGNLHKWACGPKGSGFLWVRPDLQPAVHPVTISHFLDEGLAREFNWQGTRDLSAWLSIPKALEFMANFGWEKVRAHNHAMAIWVQQLLVDAWNVEAISPADGSLLGSMASVPLPAPLDRLNTEATGSLQKKLYEEYRIEVALMNWNSQMYARPCCQIYNNSADFIQLARAIEEIGNSHASL